MKVELTRTQHRAINALRGAPERVHLMIMCSSPTATGGVLEGSEKVFEELVRFLEREVCESIVSKSAAGTLHALCRRVDPGSAEWFGT
jgi:hypothetical protein